MLEAEEAWLVDWFRRRNTNIGDTPDLEMVDADYFDKNFIDSFGVIELVAEAEEHFGVRFTELDFQDRRFSTVWGLAQIIRSKR